MLATGAPERLSFALCIKSPLIMKGIVEVIVKSIMEAQSCQLDFSLDLFVFKSSSCRLT